MNDHSTHARRNIECLLDPVFAPPAVNAEFGSLPAGITVESPKDREMVAALRLVVDPGESEAITLAYEKGLRIILDDRKAREVAQRLGVAVTGTVGLLLRAKQEGVVTTIRPILDGLAAHQFRIADALMVEALR